jgi:hypothetical protein
VSAEQTQKPLTSRLPQRVGIDSFNSASSTSMTEWQCQMLLRSQSLRDGARFINHYIFLEMCSISKPGASHHTFRSAGLFNCRSFVIEFGLTIAEEPSLEFDAEVVIPDFTDAYVHSRYPCIFAEGRQRWCSPRFRRSSLCHRGLRQPFSQESLPWYALEDRQNWT